MDACDALDGWADLLISGCGQERWPVDVRTHLAVLLEQLPDVLKAIAARESAEIYLYEQGVDRLLTLGPKGAGVLRALQKRHRLEALACGRGGRWLATGRHAGCRAR